MRIKKKVTHRVLTNLDVKILKFIWRWKLANILTLVYALAPQRSFWKFYRFVRRLYLEGYIKEVSDSSNSMALWTLTKKGFQYIDDGSLGLVQKRYQPQALSHDYWATVFQLGEFLLNTPSNVELVTEQEFTAKEIADLPNWVPQTKEHIPDGLTKLLKPSGPCVLAFEVELSAKSDSRYEEMIRYLDHKQEINFVCWLCANENIIQKITQQLTAVRRIRPRIHNFVLTKDVQVYGWSASFLWGEFQQRTFLDLLGQAPGSYGDQSGVISRSQEIIHIYFSKAKSPASFKYLGRSVDPLKILTP